MKTIIVIDLSYFVFYRYFAIVTWLKLNQEKSPEEITSITSDVMSNDFFLQKFKDMFKATIKKLIRTHAKFMDYHIIFAQDCPRNTIWRNDIADGYKSCRDDRGQNNFDGNIFCYTFDTVLPDITSSFNASVISYERAEGDDIAAIITNRLREMPDTNIVIITNDDDYLQLTSKNDTAVVLYNLQGKNLYDRAMFETGDKNLLYKVIVGDTSDDIPSICKRIGKKRGSKLVENPTELQALFAKSPECRERFDHNMRMINFDMIPDDIRAGIEEKFEEHIVEIYQ
jgi:5'-3' exonuclease